MQRNRPNPNQGTAWGAELSRAQVREKDDPPAYTPPSSSRGAPRVRHDAQSTPLPIVPWVLTRCHCSCVCKQAVGDLSPPEPDIKVERLGTRAAARPAPAAAAAQAGALPLFRSGASWGASAATGSAARQVAELQLEDADGDEFAFTTAPAATRSSAGGPRAAPSFQPLDISTQRGLARLLFGRSQGQAPKSWKQGLYFDRTPGCGYGLVQREGGPCGVLASIQAFLLANLHDGSRFNTSPSPLDRDEALAAAVARICWQAGGGLSAMLVGCSRPGGTAALSWDQLLGSLTVATVSSEAEAREAARSLLRVYQEPEGWGLVMVALGAILSRGGCGAVEGDMDSPDTGLMGSHQYCTQDLVNLLLTGRACSNVFDGDKDLDGHLLRGIQARGRVGLLTLTEW